MVSKGHASRKLDTVILPYLGLVIGHPHSNTTHEYLASYARLPLANRYHTIGAILSLVRHA